MAQLRIVMLLFVAWAMPVSGAMQEPTPLRLLRTVFVGAPQLPVTEIQRYIKDGHTEYFGYVLARSALIVLGENRDWSAEQSVQLLERSLELLDTAQASLFAGDGMHGGFGTDDVLFTLVYALVQSGQSDQAAIVLAKHLDAASDFTRAVALQALRFIGSSRANELVKGRGREDKDAHFRTNLLADIYFPFFDDLHRRQATIPPGQRGRHELLKIAKGSCGERPALAIYLLGFMSPNEDTTQQRAELETLRAATGLDCYYSRYFAFRALALRRDGNPAFWIERYRREKDPWLRAHLVRSLYSMFGRSVLPQALDLLATEPSQNVQWELMHGNLALRQGRTLRDEWDMWLPATLLYRLNFHPPASRMSSNDSDELIRWLDRGKRPEDRIVRNILLWDLVRAISPNQTRRFLRVIHHQSDRPEAWWVLDELRDPGALPMLRYWTTLPAGPEQLKRLKSVIQNLEAQATQGAPGNAADCCSPDRTCLLAHVRYRDLLMGVAPIENEKQAMAWLSREDGGQDDILVRFADPLERIAEVRIGARGPQRWEHLYGCWQHIGEP